MCLDCWEIYGSPKLDNINIRESMELVKRIYDYHCTGGHLHIVLDDWNLDDGDLRFCEQYILENNLLDIRPQSDKYYLKYQKDCYQRFIDDEVKLINLFKKMSLEERASTLWRLHEL